MPLSLSRATLWLALLLPVAASAQELRGTVTDAETREPLAGATVRVPGTTVGAATDFRGAYRFVLPAGADSIEVSFVGYVTTRFPIEGRGVIDVALAPEVIAGEEVVVVALGLERERRTLGYSVQELQGAELAGAELNVVSSLQGRLAGVQIAQSATGPGGTPRVSIRGDRFIGDFGNEPLVVVDGIPVQGGGRQSVGAFGGFDYGGGLGDVDPNDIESITVLRGANAAALYGSLAANGALLITTRRGAERSRVTVSNTTTVGTPLVLPELQNAFGRGSGGTVCGAATCPETDGVPTVQPGDTSWGAPADGRLVRNWTGGVTPYAAQPNNVADFFSPLVTSANAVSFSTGGPTASARFSLGHTRTGGLIPDHRIARTNLSVRASSRLFDRVEVDGLVSYIGQDAFNRPSLTQNPDNVIHAFIHMPRTERLEDLADFQTPDGRARIWTNTISFRSNPYWAVNLNTNEDQRQRGLGYLRLRSEITPWLSGFVRAGLDYTNFRRELRVADFTPYKAGGLGEYRVERSESILTNYDALVTARGPLAADLRGELSVGGSLRQSEGELVGHFGQGLIVTNLFTVANLTAPQPVYGYSAQATRSLYALAQLGWRGLLFVDVSGRADWASSLPEENNRYFYPAVTGSFFFSDLVEFPPLTSGKLRASWAEVGNDTQPYRTRLRYTLEQGHDGQPFGSVPTVLPLVDLRPQLTRSVEGGTDLGFWDDRLEAAITLYGTATRNQILRLPIPSSSGFREGFVNAGSIRNDGAELFLRGRVFPADRPYGWDVTLTWSTNRSRVEQLADDLDTYTLSTALGVSIVAEAGRPFGEIRGSAFLRNSEGDRVIGADGLPVRDPETRLLGNFQSDWIGGLANTFRWREASLRVLLDVRQGGEVFSLTNAVAAAQGTAAFTVEGREAWYAGTGGYVAEGVVNTGTPGDPVWERNTRPVDPQAYWTRVGGEGGIAEAWVYDGSYVKLREVSLAYRIPPRLLRAAPVRTAQVSVVGRNLAILHKNTPGFDPEATYSVATSGQGREAFAFPSTRSIGLSLNLEL